jgi:hypothetical protein
LRNKKFLQQLPIYIYAILISFLASLLVLRQKNFPRSLKIFPIFLLVTLIVELDSVFLINKVGNNIAVYNIFSIIEFEFYLYIIRKIIINKRVKKVISYTMVIFPLLCLYNIFVINDIYHFHVATFSLGCLIIVIYAIYYFYELFANPSAVDLKKEPAFWIITGLLFFYTCTFPIYGLANFISGLSVIARNIGAVLVIINVILYSLFTVAFLCKIKIPKYMS